MDRSIGAKGVLLALGLGLAVAVGCSRSPVGVVRLATTTSAANTGLLDLLTEQFQKDTGIRVDLIVTGTGEAHATFISRADDSGTHKKELHFWEVAGLEPHGAWYVEAGQGMGACLTMAHELRAYILMDRGTYLARSNTIETVGRAESRPAW